MCRTHLLCRVSCARVGPGAGPRRETPTSRRLSHDLCARVQLRLELRVGLWSAWSLRWKYRSESSGSWRLPPALRQVWKAAVWGASGRVPAWVNRLLSSLSVFLAHRWFSRGNDLINRLLWVLFHIHEQLLSVPLSPVPLGYIERRFCLLQSI